jgi:hypothetical protein
METRQTQMLMAPQHFSDVSFSVLHHKVMIVWAMILAFDFQWKCVMAKWALPV